MLLGYFDYLVIGILIFINIKVWNTYNEKDVGCIGIAILFGFLLPFVSMSIELSIVGEWVDSFEVLYTYLRFPIYWVMGMLLMIIIIINLNVKTDSQKENDRIQ